MSNGRNAGSKRNTGRDVGRDAGGFVAIPWTVLDCPAYQGLSHPARALLMEVARQFVRDNNGRLLLSFARLSKRGWKSSDVITRAKRELLAAGLIFETVMGHRPNKASWYAVTWRTLDKLPGYDAGADQLFERGAYQNGAKLRPSHGAAKPSIAPPHGIGKIPPTPPHGAIRHVLPHVSTPSHGNHLEMPSTAHRTTH